MLKALWLLALLCLFVKMDGQTTHQLKPVKNKLMDSIQAAELKETMVYDLPIIAVNENEKQEANTPFVPSLLSANRDVFINMASLHFSSERFRIRGYDANFFSTQINGMHMNDLIDGSTQWSLWSGLNEVTRNTQIVSGLTAGEHAFGNIGNEVNIDMRASTQREQTQFGYTFSNRTYMHRWMFTKTVGLNKKAWAYSVSGNFRVADEGYFPGTGYSGGSYFIAVDKQLNDHLLSLGFFGNATVQGKQGPTLDESVALANTPFYNPYWGYQNGKKRNANVSRTHQPVLILTDDHRIDNNTSIIATMGFVFGEKTSTALDWYKAPDPRPDYYHYLPGYQTDSVLRVDVADALKNNEQLRQINWNNLYDVNKHSTDTLNNANGIAGNSISGLRSHYIVEESIAATKRFDANIAFHTRVNEAISVNGGASVQIQQTHFYKKINDLLGGDYFVDWNQFAERDYPNDTNVIQDDLNHPNRIVQKGDVYGYDYIVHIHRSGIWGQIAVTRKKFDLFAATEISWTVYQREGKMKNGLFPFNSFGRSAMNAFTNYALKAGATYKINGRKYFYINTGILSNAPLFDNVFISPRTRDTRQENINNEKIISVESGYVWNAPAVKLRLNAYLTGFTNGMNVTTFYHDVYGTFVNYALWGIDKIHFGTELGMEYTLTNRFAINLGASVGRYYYNSRQHVSVSVDNEAYVLDKTIIYSQNFRIGGTPQEAYSIGTSYQPGSSFYLTIAGNYFRKMWVDFNPLRRTYAALENVVAGSEQWNKIIDQTLLPDQFTADLSAGSSVRLKLFHSKHRHILGFHLSINNLLNNQHLVSGGYEQLRFDADTKDTDKFPPKYFHAMGLNFSANFSLRL